MITGFRSILFKFLAFALITVLLFLLLLNTLLNPLPSGSRSFTAYFTSVSGLTPGSNVRVAGVRVGKVTSINLVPNPGSNISGIATTGPDGQQDVAAVSFDLENAQSLYSTTQIEMLYQNLLGQRFLSLSQDTSPSEMAASTPLRPDASIPATRTNPGFDLTQLLDGFRPLFQVLQPSQVNQLANSIIQVLQGEGGSIQNLLQQTTQVTNFLAGKDQIVGQVLANLTPVLEDFAGQGIQLARTVSTLRQLMQGLASDRSSIGASISHLSTLITSTSDLIEQARAPAVADVHLFRQVVETTNAEKALLSRALGGFGGVFGAFGRGTSYGGAGSVYACSVTLNLAGVEINLSGQPGGGPWTAVCQ